MKRRSGRKEYHLVWRTAGISFGGFETLYGARQYAREENLPNWQIFVGNWLVEDHDPDREDPPVKPLLSWTEAFARPRERLRSRRQCWPEFRRGPSDLSL